ncbi:hypothetical protein BAE44_0024807 [Dichanthelium oligosanthes]|uniref:Uncharacterized protein n=1 Tax=Dichanthelium oligosanthes TaxID=888268 RepID=A0A1E5UMT9_9POAL|nr:hypothetical protein BAE44_0024807 [Dichanthelium oligosanthes]
MAREPVRRVVGAVASSAPHTRKRSRDGFDGKIIRDREGSAAGEVSVVPASSGQQRLQERMRVELDAVRALHRKAVLLCRGGPGRSGTDPAAKGDARCSAVGPKQEARLQAAAKRKKTSPSKPTSNDDARFSAAGPRSETSLSKPAPEAAKQSTEPVKQQHRSVQRAMLPPTKLSVAKPVDKAREILKRRRLEEIAQAREKCRQEVLEVERTALPDETVYPRDLQELGIAYQYAVTRTRRQAGLNGGE